MRLYAKDILSETIVFNGYTVTKLADETGVTRGHLYTVLSRKNSISPHLAIRISRKLGKSTDELFFINKKVKK
jgi:plasmid maintenance system antidote protein VapI